jgi:hypothetical protein
LRDEDQWREVGGHLCAISVVLILVVALVGWPAIYDFAVPAAAKEPANGSTVLGYGARLGGCSEFARAPEGSFNYTAAAQWILGFLSAWNMDHQSRSYVANITGGRPNEAVIDWVRNWCRAHPLAPIDDAMGPLFDELLR